MSGLRDANRRVRGAVGERGIRWGSVARWSGTAFLAAGGLLLVSAVLTVVGTFTNVSTDGMLTGITVFTGVIGVCVGLLGLYPRVRDRTPRLARVGVVLIAVPSVAVLALLVWGTLGHTLSVVPVPIAVIPAIGLVFVAVFLLFTAGTMFFGAASLRSDRLPRTVGLLLFALGATWLLHFAAGSTYGTAFPEWFDALLFGLLSAITLAIGYQLRVEPARADPGRASPDS